MGARDRAARGFAAHHRPGGIDVLVGASG
jgi:hypothetical protein